MSAYTRQSRINRIPEPTPQDLLMLEYIKEQFAWGDALILKAETRRGWGDNKFVRINEVPRQHQAFFVQYAKTKHMLMRNHEVCIQFAEYLRILSALYKSERAKIGNSAEA